MDFNKWLVENETFYNDMDLENSINKLVNEKFLKGVNPKNLRYIRIIDGKAEISYGNLSSIYIKKMPLAVKFFLEELGCTVLRVYSREGDSITMDIVYPKHELGDYKYIKDYELRRCLSSGNCVDVSEVGYDLGDGRWLINRYISGVRYYFGDRRLKYIYLDYDGKIYGSMKKPEQYDKIFNNQQG